MEKAETLELFLDPNRFQQTVQLLCRESSLQRMVRFAVYTISEGGSDWNKLIVINALTMAIAGRYALVKFSGITWKKERFYYSTYDQPKEGSQLPALPVSIN